MDNCKFKIPDAQDDMSVVFHCTADEILPEGFTGCYCLSPHNNEECSKSISGDM